MDAYKKQFNRDVADRNVQWFPNVCCGSCYRRLHDEKRSIKYSNPATWNEPINHPEDCYFCKTIVPAGRNKFKRNKVSYPDPNTVSVVNAVTHGDDESDFNSENETEAAESMEIDVETVEQPSTSGANVSPSVFPPNLAYDFDLIQPANQLEPQDQQSDTISQTISSHEQYIPPKHFSELQPKRPKVQSPRLTQAVLNDLIRDLGLSKEKSQLLASRLVQLLKEFDPEIQNGLYF